MFKVPEKFRLNMSPNHPMHSDESFGNNGWFEIPITKKKGIFCIASDQLGWEHVSVSISCGRLPTYYEMKRVRRLFWGDDDVVVEYHFGEKDHINIKDNVLHLWRKVDHVFETPPTLMV